MSRIFVNTNEYKREGLLFLKNGFYCSAPKQTVDYYDYWHEQTKRCKEGYSVGGVKITGRHYFYLNFCRIDLVPQEDLISPQIPGKLNRKKVQKIHTFPAFWDGDYDFYWALDIAQYGIEKKELDKLALDVNISSLDGGHHLIVLKARGKGYSYKGAGLMAQNFCQGRNSKNFALADDNEYLLKDGLLTKTWDYLSFLDVNTAWAQPRLKDTDNHKIAGYKSREETGFVERGRLNQVMGITLKDNADKGRGKRGDLALFEEAGKSGNLLKAWEVARPSFEQGSITTGMMMAYGTGGSVDEAQAGLEELFYNPEAHNCLAFENIWDDGAQGTNCGFFVPAYQNYEGYMDIEGNSYLEDARDFLEKEREKKKKSPNPKVVTQFVAEQPFNPQEAFTQSSVNIFPVAELQAQRNAVIREGRHQSLTNCTLYEDSTGNVKVNIGLDVPPPVVDFPLKKGSDPRGCIQILEAPVRIGGKVPEKLYMIVHDPYGKDQSTEQGSLGAAYVIKMWNNFSTTYMGCIVASYVGRPATMDDYNDQLFKLAKYYNCIGGVGFENNKGSVISYAKQHKLLQYLMPEPTVGKKTITVVNSTNWGITTSEPMKDMGEIYLRDWLMTPLTTRQDGTQLKILHTILDVALLRELTRFNRKKGNFDRVMALLTGQFFIEERKMLQVAPKIEEKPAYEEFFNRKMFA